MSKWLIGREEYFSRLKFTEHEFQDELRLPNVSEVLSIVPLQDIKTIFSLIRIHPALLTHIIRNIRTIGGQLPFAGASIELTRGRPDTFGVGQKFCYREKYMQILENVPNILNGFLGAVGGLFDLEPCFVFGESEQGEYVMACYLPPLIEEHGVGRVVMDGIHRNWLALPTNATPVIVRISNVSIPFPCSIHSWSDLQVIPLSEKPKDIHDRYFELNEGLFRDLKHLGIDG